MLRRFFVLLFVALITATAGQSAFVENNQDEQKKQGTHANAPTFQNDVRPLLQAKCSRCHNEKAHKADLDLTTLSGILKGGESGAVLEPGKPNESLLFEKVHDGSYRARRIG